MLETVSLERSLDVRFLLDDGGLRAVAWGLEGRGRNRSEALANLKRQFEAAEAGLSLVPKPKNAK